MNTKLAALTMAALAVAALAVSSPSQAPLPPCETEDSVSCYWDADTQGNGLGVDVENGPELVPPCRVPDCHGATSELVNLFRVESGR